MSVSETRYLAPSHDEVELIFSSDATLFSSEGNYSATDKGAGNSTSSNVFNDNIYPANDPKDPPNSQQKEISGRKMFKAIDITDLPRSLTELAAQPAGQECRAAAFLSQSYAVMLLVIFAVIASAIFLWCLSNPLLIGILCAGLVLTAAGSVGCWALSNYLSRHAIEFDPNKDTLITLREKYHDSVLPSTLLSISKKTWTENDRESKKIADDLIYNRNRTYTPKTFDEFNNACFNILYPKGYSNDERSRWNDTALQGLYRCYQQEIAFEDACAVSPQPPVAGWDV